MTPEEMQKRKKELGLTYDQISRFSGVPVPTIQKIISGTTEAPGALNRAAIESVLLGPAKNPRVAESVFAYGAGRQGSYTAADYYALPDDERWELIDGVLYNMSSAGFNHQLIVSGIRRFMEDYVRANKGACMVIDLPLDSKVSSDELTIVQPDVMVICDRGKIRKWGIFGAPDLVVEVLSPSTRSKDCKVKYNKYLSSGVREYWIVDPDQERVFTYDFTQEPVFPGVYTFADKVPVTIWGGRCVVDFAEIRSQLIAFPEE